MDKSKLIETIKSQLKSLLSNEVKFAEVKAGDLLISSPDETLVVGSEVFTIDQDGNNIPLADGDYTLDSGEKVTVVAGKVEGMIASAPEEVVAEDAVVEEEEPVVEEVLPEGETEEMPEEDAIPEDMVKALETRIAKCESMLEEMSKANNKMAQELSKVSSEPSAEPITVEPTEFKSVEDKKSGFSNIDIMAIREKARKNR